MSTSGGLSRRRVGANGGATSSYDDDDGNRLSSINNGGSGGGGGVGGGSRSTTPVVSPLSQHAHAGSAFEGGGKIAFDPRDLQQDASEEARTGGKMPRLTIMEEVLLLGIKDKQVNPFSLLFVFLLLCIRFEKKKKLTLFFPIL
jgi:golgi phosphoprotein 3